MAEPPREPAGDTHQVACHFGHMTYIYDDRAEVGIEIARRIYEAIALKTRSPWNQRCLISSKTGLPVWGHDYYSDMVIWTVPMALANQSVGEFVAEGGLIDRMINAAQRQKGT